MPVRHSFSSVKADGADASLVRKTEWNADHAVTNTVAPSTGNFGDAAAPGSSVHPALADHVHGREANPLTQSAGDETLITPTTTGSFELSPANDVYQVRWNGAANATLIGIAGGLANRRMVFRNISTAFFLTLSHEDATEATAANRFSLPGNVDFVVGPRQSIEVIYQSVSNRWIAVANPMVPSGAIMAYAGAAAPPGWLFCNGASLLRTDYPSLFAAIGTVYGSVDATHFTLPMLCYDGTIGQGRFPMGRRSSGTGTALGDNGGSIDHAHDGHGGVLGTHAAATPNITGSVGAALGGSSATVGGTNAAGATHNHQAGTLVNSSHAHDAHTGTHAAANPPFLAVMYIIAV